MCFPSKWLKNNFTEEERPRASGSKPAGEAERPASVPADKPATNGTTVATNGGSKSFKTAIVIYTMYGHIASREYEQSLHSLYQCNRLAYGPLFRQLLNPSRPA